MSWSALVIPLSKAAEIIRDALRTGHIAADDRALTDAVGRILHAEPGAAVDEAALGDRLRIRLAAPWHAAAGVDARSATARAGMAVGRGRRGIPEWRTFIKQRTPQLFLGKNVLLRKRDLEAA